MIAVSPKLKQREGESKASCLLQFPVGDAQKVLSDAIKDSVPVADIFYAFSALKNLGLQGEIILSSFNLKINMQLQIYLKSKHQSCNCPLVY